MSVCSNIHAEQHARKNSQRRSNVGQWKVGVRILIYSYCIFLFPLFIQRVSHTFFYPWNALCLSEKFSYVSSFPFKMNTFKFVKSRFHFYNCCKNPDSCQWKSLFLSTPCPGGAKVNPVCFSKSKMASTITPIVLFPIRRSARLAAKKYPAWFCISLCSY